MTTDKSKSQAWDELIDEKLNNKFAKSQGLAKKYYKNGVQFALDNLHRVLKVSELLENIETLGDTNVELYPNDLRIWSNKILKEFKGSVGT